MPKFEDFLTAFNYDPSVFNPVEFKAALQAAHNEDVSLWAAKVSDTENAVKKLTEESDKLKVAAWDAMMKTGTPIVPNNASGAQVTPDPAEDPNEPELKGLQSFLTPKE